MRARNLIVMLALQRLFVFLAAPGYELPSAPAAKSAPLDVSGLLLSLKFTLICCVMLSSINMSQDKSCLE